MKKKEQILKSAMVLFSQEGVQQTTLDGIAKHSRVSIGAIYHHFSGKESIFQEVLTHTTINLENKISNAMQSSLADSKIKHGDELLRYFSILIKQDRAALLKASRFVFANSFYSEQLRDYIQNDFLERHRRFIEASLNKMISEHHADPFNTRNVSRIIANYLISVALKVLTSRGFDGRANYLHFARDYKYIIRCAIEGRLV